VRKEQIIVKGKGLMQTYWCEPDDNASFIQETISLIHADVAAEMKAD
jgi:long-subunit acyl-CoA synthetase (AMP-forming)